MMATLTGQTASSHLNLSGVVDFVTGDHLMFRDHLVLAVTVRFAPGPVALTARSSDL